MTTEQRESRTPQNKNINTFDQKYIKIKVVCRIGLKMFKYISKSSDPTERVILIPRSLASHPKGFYKLVKVFRYFFLLKYSLHLSLTRLIILFATFTLLHRYRGQSVYPILKVKCVLSTFFFQNKHQHQVILHWLAFVLSGFIIRGRFFSFVSF